MPYIADDRRDSIFRYDPNIDSMVGVASELVNPGDLNFVISKLCRAYYMQRGHSYETHNDIIGVLECAKQEWYRRCATPYEDYKLNENGDIYE